MSFSHLCEKNEECMVLKIDTIRRILRCLKEAFLERGLFKQICLHSFKEDSLQTGLFAQLK